MKSRKAQNNSARPLASQLVQQLIDEARLAQKKSHSPYSGFKIGAAVLTDQGDIYSGANVENSSYGATVCAERVAIWSAVTDSLSKSKSKKNFLDVICVVSPSKEAWPPPAECAVK